MNLRYNIQKKSWLMLFLIGSFAFNVSAQNKSRLTGVVGLKGTAQFIDIFEGNEVLNHGEFSMGFSFDSLFFTGLNVGVMQFTINKGGQNESVLKSGSLSFFNSIRFLRSSKFSPKLGFEVGFIPISEYVNQRFYSNNGNLQSNSIGFQIAKWNPYFDTEFGASYLWSKIMLDAGVGVSFMSYNYNEISAAGYISSYEDTFRSIGLRVFIGASYLF